MNQFSLLNYLLIIFVALSFYPYGRKLGIRSFFSSIVVGLCFSGLIAGLLANVCAGLIRPILILLIALGAIATFFELKKNLEQKDYFVLLYKKYRLLYLILILTGIALFVFNNPAKIFFQRDNDKNILLFNRHYSYYSSQSVEMLNAKYFSRLRVANLYPHEWSQYHFFNSGTQAAAQSLIKHPSLFTFWMAQTVITILILLSFAEIFFQIFGFRFKNALIFFVWLVIGFTLFSDSLTWNLYSTGALSVFAIIQLLFALWKIQPRLILIYTVILGVSAFRLLPISLLFLAFSCYLLFDRYKTNQKLNWLNLRKLIGGKVRITPFDFWVIFLAISYNILTIVSAKPADTSEKISLIAARLFDNAWMNLLTVYKFAGLANYALNRPNDFSQFNKFNFFGKVIYDPLKLKVTLLVCAGVSLLALWWLIKYLWQNRLKVAKWLPLIILVAVNYFFVSPDVIALHFLAFLYFIISLLLFFLIKRRGAKPSPHLLNSIIALYFIVLLFQYIGLDSSIREPALYIVFDVLAWGVVGLFLFVYADRKFTFYPALALSLVLPILFSFQLSGVLRMTEIDRHFMKIDVTSLTSKETKRADYVDSSNKAKFHFDDPNLNDVYSTVLGANLDYSDDHNMFINYSFTEK